MSFFEWLGESYDPGAPGVTEFGPRQRGKPSRLSVLVRAFISLLLLGGIAFVMHQKMGIREFHLYRNTLVAVGFYSLVAYHVHPEPDTSNMGWLGGLIDHPFRYTDDANRFLLFLLILLFPGRFWSEALVDLFRLIRCSVRRTPPPAGRA